MQSNNNDFNFSVKNRAEAWEILGEAEKTKEERSRRKSTSTLEKRSALPLEKSSTYVYKTAQQAENPGSVSFKLNVRSSLKGLNKSTIADLIKQGMPTGTYSRIKVSNIKKHLFEGEKDPVSARKIILTRLNTTVAAVSLKVLLTSLLGKNIQDQREKYESTLNLALIREDIQEHLKDNPDRNEEEKKNAEQEITKAFARCMTITLTISDDCNFAEIKGDQSEVFIVARKVGQQLRFLYKKDMT